MPVPVSCLGLGNQWVSSAERELGKREVAPEEQGPRGCQARAPGLVLQRPPCGFGQRPCSQSPLASPGWGDGAGKVRAARAPSAAHGPLGSRRVGGQAGPRPRA